jgi:hypothetical protein
MIKKILLLLLLVAVTSSLRLQKIKKTHNHKVLAKTRLECQLPVPYDVIGECHIACEDGEGLPGAECAEGERCCPTDIRLPSAEPAAPTAADPVTTDDPAAHTAIWFHGQNSCRNLKVLAQYPGRTDVITPISPTDDGGANGNMASGGTCHNWGMNEDPWPRDMPTTAQLTVSGFSMGRHGFYNFIRFHGDHVQRAVLFDPSYDDGTYDGKKGMEIVRTWLRGDSSRIFVFAYGGSTLMLGIAPFKKYFIDETTDDIRQQVFVVHDTNIIHGLIPATYKACLFDNTCGGRSNHDYNAENYRR